MLLHASGPEPLGAPRGRSPLSLAEGASDALTRRRFCGTCATGVPDGSENGLKHQTQWTTPTSYLLETSAQGRNRTSDTGIFSPLLYQLSYLGEPPTRKAVALLPVRAGDVKHFVDARVAVN